MPEDPIFQATLPDGLSGPWYAVVQTDSGNALFELDKTNNVEASAVPILIESRPADLGVTGLAVPSSAQAGASLLVSWSIQNQGSGDTAVSRWSDRLVLSSDATLGNADDVTLLTVEHNGLLAPDGTYTVSNQVVTIPFAVTPGTWRLFAVTDAGNALYEGANEGNNASTPRTITITRTTADLRMTSISLSPIGGVGQREGVLSVLSEDTILVSWRVENIGAASPNSTIWSDAVYLSTNAVWTTNAVLLGAAQNPASLAPGAFYTNALAVTLPSEIQGDFFVHMLANAASEVIEDNSANNTLAATNTLQVTLRPVPDLAVLSVASPADGYSGQFFEMSWTVTNRGPATADGTWFDSVYLSLDPQFEPDFDTYIGYAERPSTLTNGQSYTQTTWLEIPPEVSGMFYVFVVCDSTGRVNERGGETNNVGRAAQSVSVWIRPPADLVVGTITIPTNAVAGYEMALTYVLRNLGTNAAFGPWADALYLSADDQWDIADALFARVSQTGFLAGGDSRTNTVSAPAPGVVPGDYHVIIRTDVVNQVPETNEFNNITASLDRTAVEVAPLVLGVAATNQLANRQPRYYRVHPTVGQWLVVELACDSPSAATESFVSYGTMPTRSQFDFIHSNPLQPNHRIIVPNTREGDYYILVYGDFIPAPGSAAITLMARLGQFLVLDTSVGKGGNAGNLTIPINGVNFDRTCTAGLTNATGLDRPALSHYYENSTRFYATLDLRGLTPGFFTVAVENGDGSTVVVPDPLEVVAASGLPTTIPVVSAPRAVRDLMVYQFNVGWANDGLNDAPAPLLTVGNTVAFGLSAGDYSLGTRYTFLGINTQGGPPGILRPGQTEFMMFYSKAGSLGAHQSYTAFADRVGKTSSDPMDWNRVRPNLPAEELIRRNFNTIWSQFTNQIGGTWGDYLAMLARNASLLPASMGDNRSPGDLERLEWRKALTAQTLSISGRVTSDSALVEVGNVEVLAVPQSGENSPAAWSLTDGVFVLPDVAPGLYAMEVRSAQGRLQAPVAADTRGGQSATNLVLSLRAGAGLVLEVTDSSGIPMAGAQIIIGPATNPVAVALADWGGRTSLAGLPTGVQTVFVEAKSFAPLMTSVMLAGGGTTTRWLTLNNGGEVKGVVQLASGQMAANAVVLLESQFSHDFLSRAIQTDPQGNFAFASMADGYYVLTIISPESAVYTSMVELSGTTQVDLGRISLPDRPAPSRTSRKDAGCEDYTLGNQELQIILGLMELEVRAKLPIVREFRGEEYKSVVRDYLDNCYPNYRMRFFGPRSETVEAESLGPGTFLNVPGLGEFYGAGFRKHPKVMEIVDSIRAAVLDAFKVFSIHIDPQELCKSGQQTFTLDQVLREEFRNYWDGQGGDPVRFRAEPKEDYWEFPGTLAGGLGASGRPLGNWDLLYPDRRLITGKILAVPAGKGQAQLWLGDLEFQIWDAFDFIPGSLGNPVFAIGITAELRILEFFNYAYDIPVYVHWSQPGQKLYQIGSIDVPDFDPENCDPCKKPNPPDYCAPCKRPNPPDDCADTEQILAWDPNDIVGPRGFGTERWISSDQTFHYTVRFENDPRKVTAPAQIVRITQRLDPNLDLRTFRLAAIGFGDTLVSVPLDRAFFQTRVNVTNTLGVLVEINAGLDLGKGEVTWEFSSLDPATGELPWDPYAGFLPPNTNGIIGQGFVSYTIKPKAGIASGDIINAEARIFFDYNEPMDTPHIFNTVDASLPTSTVLPLPLATNRNIFPVRWAGTDAYGGAGVGSFDLYVSDNSGPWKLWLQNTRYWEQLFVGECGHTYAFYSVARDNVGHVEAAAPVAQAQTYVLPNTLPVLAEIRNRVLAPGQRLSITNVATDFDSPGQTLSFSLEGSAPAGMVIDPQTGVLTWMPRCVQGNSSNAVSVRVTDDGCGNLSSSRSFAVVVTECLQVALGGAVAQTGHGDCVSFYLESSDDLTNLTFTLVLPTGRFTNLTAMPVASEVWTGRVDSVTTGEAVVTFVAQEGQTMRGPKELARVCFTLLPTQQSAFVALRVEDVVGIRANGAPLGNESGRPGRAVIVGAKPLLEAVHWTNGQPALVLYAQSETTNVLETTTSLSEAATWTVDRQVVMTNLQHVIQPVCTNRCTLFFRARRE